MTHPGDTHAPVPALINQAAYTALTFRGIEPTRGALVISPVDQKCMCCICFMPLFNWGIRGISRNQDRQFVKYSVGSGASLKNVYVLAE